MAKGFINEVSIRAKDIDALNKHVISAYIDDGVLKGDDIDGGSVFNITKTKHADVTASNGTDGLTDREVWRISAPLTKDNDDFDEDTILANANGLAMAYNPNTSLVRVNGKDFTGLTVDVRDLTNVGLKPFNAFYLKKYDLVELSADCITGTYVATGGAGVETKYLVPDDGSYKLKFSTSSTIDYTISGTPDVDKTVQCTCLEIKEVRQAQFPSNKVGNEYVTTYLCEVISE